MSIDNRCFALVCPECGEEALTRPPRNWVTAWGPAPRYSHIDGEPLCPVMTTTGYKPAQAVTPEDAP